MEREGNVIGAEGRRQHDEDDPQHGDKPDMEERIADREAREAEEEGVARIEAEQEDQETGDPVPDPDEAGLDDVGSSEGVKPGVVAELEDAEGVEKE